MHTHDYPREIRTTLIWAIVLNAVFVVIQIYFGLRAHSLALLADAGHNFGDVLGLLLAAAAIWLAAARPQKGYTYGLQSATILAALGNALLMLFAVFEVAHEAIERLLVGGERPDNTLIVAVGAAGGVLNLITAVFLHKGHKTDLNLSAMYWHMFSDALVSLGVVAAGLLIGWTGWTWLDPLTGLLIAATILWGTWKLLQRALRLALQGVPTDVQARAVEGLLRSRPGVSDVHDLHIWALGTRQNAMSAHLVMPAGHPGDAFIEQTQAELERHGIHHATLQIELGNGHCGCDCGH